MIPEADALNRGRSTSSNSLLALPVTYLGWSFENA